MKATMRSFVRALALAGALGISSMAGAQTPPGEDELATHPPLFLQLARTSLGWGEPEEPGRIAGPIYFIGTRGLGVFLIRSSEGLIVINTGMPGSGPMTADAIRKLGMDPRDIRLLLTGHAHSDHAGALAYLQQLSGAHVAVIQEEKDLLESGGSLDFLYGRYEEFAFEPPRVTRVLRDGGVLQLGDVAVTALLTGGHTPGSATFVTEVEEGGTRYTVVFPDGLSIDPGYRMARDPSYPGIGDNYLRTLRILETLTPDIWLAPHNETYDFEGKRTRSAREGAAAWVDPEGYRRWLRAQRVNFETAVGRELGTSPGPQP
jgi:metallo-beta-lactamase class B